MYTLLTALFKYIVLLIIVINALIHLRVNGDPAIFYNYLLLLLATIIAIIIFSKLDNL